MTRDKNLDTGRGSEINWQLFQNKYSKYHIATKICKKGNNIIRDKNIRDK